MWDDLDTPKRRRGGFRWGDLGVHYPAMRRTLATTCLAILLLAGAAGGSAQATEVGYGRNFGLGFEIGNPTGFVGKYWLGRTNALDFGLGFDGYYGSYGQYCTNNNNGVCNGRFTIHADYLWQSNLVRSSAQLDWHIGAGGRINFWNNNNNSYASVGARMPVGLDLMFNNPSFLELFFEIAPIIYIAPNVGQILWFSFDGSLGVRFYF